MCLILSTWFSSVQFTVAQLCPTLCDPMDCSTPGFPVHHQFPELTQTHVHQVTDAIQPGHLLSSPSPLAFNLSQHQGPFKWVSSLYQVTKYWSFSFSISPSKEYSGLISCRIDWFELLVVQGAVKILLSSWLVGIKNHVKTWVCILNSLSLQVQFCWRVHNL